MRTALEVLIDYISDELEHNRKLLEEFPHVANVLLRAEELLPYEQRQLAANPITNTQITPTMSDIDFTTWKHWKELPTQETWCLIAYRWKAIGDPSRIRYQVDRTIQGEARWWGTDPLRGPFEILGWKPFEPICVQEAINLETIKQ